MDKFTQNTRDWKVGIKAFQNVQAAANALDAMITLADSTDEIVMSSLFYSAVIRYAKPFLDSNFEGGNIKYPLKRIRAYEGFSVEMHDHLIGVRNTLIAHDDFTEISPRVADCCLDFDGVHILPVTISLSNKCIHFPSDIDTVKRMSKHAHICLNAIEEKLRADLVSRRLLIIEDSQAFHSDTAQREDFSKAEIIDRKIEIEIPDTSNMAWLDNPVPDHSAIHNGYAYEEFRASFDFQEPATITWPDGFEFSITAKNPFQ